MRADARLPGGAGAPGADRPTGRYLSHEDHTLLLRLLRTPTVGPLEAQEGDPPVQLWQAQRVYAEAARAAGLRVVHHAAAEPGTVCRADVPVAVRDAARDPAFLAAQPSLVLRLGPARPVRDTVMFNVHLDTVAGAGPVSFDGERFTGRGAVDAKGPAVALLAGVRAAVAAEPALGREVAVLVQAVSGEEGGALGTFGTRPLVEAGFVGRLNVFCEPTGLHHLPRATASMTARVTVRGEDAVDDRPGAGHNATVLLGFLAQHLAAVYDRHPARRGAAGATCVAGLHTGHLHNRVHGTGHLLLNISYATAAEGAAAERALAECLADGLRAFTARFRHVPDLARTAADAERITRLGWDKRGLPCLTDDGGDPWAESLLAAAGVPRKAAGEPSFTCDAVWMHGVPGTYTTVLGPGSLDANNAHAAGEFVDLTDLEDFAAHIHRLLLTFATHRRTRQPDDRYEPNAQKRTPT
ncbi:M20 family metallopeptidase [Streptomyces albus subsp. chlorinus]|uniref:M20/M25/M40 family metallo-hydrolase n=1 Tax=Streptomyces albus TaxID=1888 RepID=UPI0015709F5A|nr:M20/M25/M40 family metallo-hydrolase [Streptomyces albus]NSC24377.1 M20 family metallopeptidase [Streptomyces albus subsp. chlorinus]